MQKGWGGCMNICFKTAMGAVLALGIATGAAWAATEQSSVSSLLLAHPSGGAEMVSDLTVSILSDPTIALEVAQNYATAKPAQQFAMASALNKAHLSAVAAGQTSAASLIQSAAKSAGIPVGTDDTDAQAQNSLSAASRVQTKTAGTLAAGDTPVSPSRP
jgi:hypothetical protein